MVTYLGVYSQRQEVQNVCRQGSTWGSAEYNTSNDSNVTISCQIILIESSKSIQSSKLVIRLSGLRAVWQLHHSLSIQSQPQIRTHNICY